jgi:hypothetical protein
LELGVVVRLPAERTEETIAALKQDGIGFDLVLVPGPRVAGERAWQTVERLAPLVAPAGVGWQDGNRADPVLSGEVMFSRFVRVLIGGSRLSQLDDPSGGEVDPEKVEALAYVEATNVLTRLGASGSATLMARMVYP